MPDLNTQYNYPAEMVEEPLKFGGENFTIHCYISWFGDGVVGYVDG